MLETDTLLTVSDLGSAGGSADGGVAASDGNTGWGGVVSDIHPVLRVTHQTIRHSLGGGDNTVVDLTVSNSVGNGSGTSIRGKLSGANGTALTPVEASRTGSGIVVVTHTVAGGSWSTLGSEDVMDGHNGNENSSEFHFFKLVMENSNLVDLYSLGNKNRNRVG